MSVLFRRAPVVKWISQQPSKLLFQVRILAGAKNLTPIPHGATISKSNTSNTFMPITQTRLTEKHQTTIPKSIRQSFGFKRGTMVTWNLVRGVVTVESSRPVSNAVKFLTSQVTLDLDAVKLIRRIREDLA